MRPYAKNRYFLHEPPDGSWCPTCLLLPCCAGVGGDSNSLNTHVCCDCSLAAQAQRSPNRLDLSRRKQGHEEPVRGGLRVWVITATHSGTVRLICLHSHDQYSGFLVFLSYLGYCHGGITVVLMSPSSCFAFAGRSRSCRAELGRNSTISSLQKLLQSDSDAPGSSCVWLLSVVFEY